MRRDARDLALPVAAGFLLRLGAVLLSDRVVADVLRFQKMGAHLLDVSWNPYLAPRLYPYPPVWMWLEAAAEWLHRETGASFAVLVKAPVLAADTLLVALLASWGRERGGPARWAGWVYALHPVALLVTGFHGQFEPLALLPLALALREHERGRYDASALALAAAIAVKSFPVLLLPFLLALPGPSARARLRYAALATLPVAILLAPYAWTDPGALGRELFGYGGVADFGWIGAWRGGHWLATGELIRGEARHWGGLITIGKLLFLAACGLGLAALLRRRLALSVPRLAALVLLAFQVLYGAVSAQYLLWPVPFAALSPDRHLLAHALAASLALTGFYLFLAPGVLTVAPTPSSAGELWAGGAAAVLVCGGVWMAALAREGLVRR